MNNKQLSRIADALEKIAGNQTDLLVILKANSALGDQNLGTHASMFSEMRAMIEPLIAGAAMKMEAKVLPDKELEPALPPQPIVLERNGIRIAAAQPNEVEVDVG